MKASLNWLREYVDITLPVAELGQKLTMSGTEVASLESVGGWENIVVGEVVAIEPHPHADHLQLATVDLGTERLSTVCGAPNLKLGQKVPFARLGAQLLDPETGQRFKLKKVKIRGIASEGMICSERELGISERHEGIMVLPADAPLGLPLDNYLGDTILDLDVTPNRPDCLSIIGIAHEIAALTGQTVRLPEVSYDELGESIEGKVSVEIIDPDLCPRYCASLITNVRVGPSPPWLEQRLLACGMRPINNIVDVTNYVMLEHGQPLHAFDYHKLAQRKILVRRPREGEFITTLDGEERGLTSDMLVIADGEGAVAIAGVMGGAESEVTEETTAILIESANFNAASIRRTSMALRLRSEASLRFEKGISPELPLPAVKRATQLMAALSGDEITKGVIDAYPGKVESKPISLTSRQVRRILGVDISLEERIKVLASLGFDCQVVGGDELSVTVPYWRTDVRLSDDLVEEIARIIGYDEFPTTLPSGSLPRYQPDPMRALRQRVSQILAGCGMQEAITYSLTSLEVMGKAVPQSQLAPLRVANPITAGQEYLRTTLRANLLVTLSANEKHEEDGIRLFEVGKVYLPREGDLPEEHYMVAGVLSGPRLDRSWHGQGGTLDFFDAKGVLETLFERLGITASFEPTGDEALSPGKRAKIVVQGQSVGILGELHPRVVESFDISSRSVYLFEIDLERLLPATLEPGKYRPRARFPATLRDVALIVDEAIPSKKVNGIIQSHPLVAGVTLFDVYTGEQVPRGKKSLAFRIIYQSPERTLTDEEVNLAQGEILERLHRELGATLRA
ncbi:MAG: phenylalanine--tRNA ligase subunit beta [Dehalococcoidia bacterium]|nr:phenylalanine--tRNA ligase subunit beta [Dehalococcoidia bacterium]